MNAIENKDSLQEIKKIYSDYVNQLKDLEKQRAEIFNELNGKLENRKKELIIKKMNHAE